MIVKDLRPFRWHIQYVGRKTHQYELPSVAPFGDHFRHSSVPLALLLIKTPHRFRLSLARYPVYFPCMFLALFRAVECVPSGSRYKHARQSNPRGRTYPHAPHFFGLIPGVNSLKQESQTLGAKPLLRDMYALYTLRWCLAGVCSRNSDPRPVGARLDDGVKQSKRHAGCPCRALKPRTATNSFREAVSS